MLFINEDVAVAGETLFPVDHDLVSIIHRTLLNDSPHVFVSEQLKHFAYFFRRGNSAAAYADVVDNEGEGVDGRQLASGRVSTECNRLLRTPD